MRRLDGNSGEGLQVPTCVLTGGLVSGYGLSAAVPRRLLLAGLGLGRRQSRLLPVWLMAAWAATGRCRVGRTGVDPQVKVFGACCQRDCGDARHRHVGEVKVFGRLQIAVDT